MQTLKRARVIKFDRAEGGDSAGSSEAEHPMAPPSGIPDFQLCCPEYKNALLLLLSSSFTAPAEEDRELGRQLGGTGAAARRAPRRVCA